jgi:hypothetical protein
VNVRTSIILLILLIMVAGTVIFSQARPQRTSIDPNAPRDCGEPFVMLVTPEDIHGVTVIHENNQIDFKQKGSDWIIQGESPTEVDLERWGGIVYLLSGPRSSRLLCDDFKALEEYGLDHPRTIIRMHAKGDRVFEYRIGNRTEDTINDYVTLKSSADIYLVDAAFTDVIVNLLYDIPYAKWYFHAEVERVSELDISKGADKVAFAKNSSRGWQFNTSRRPAERDPVDLDAWDMNVAPLLQGPQIQYRVEAAMTNPKQYGLDEPVGAIRLEYGVLEEGENQTIIEVFHQRIWNIGDKTPDGNAYYSKIFNIDPVLAIDAAWVDALLQVLESPPQLATASPTAGS